MAVQLTILGLGKIGVSVGLALAEHKDMIRRVGNDRDALLTRQAEKMGALDQVSFNLQSAVKTADIVLLAEPLPGSQNTFETIVPDLKPGAVVMDTSPAKVEQIQWVSRLLPAERSYVSVSPTLNPAVLADPSQGIDAARADLFENSFFLICAPPGTNPEAIKLVSDLIGLLGAAPLFADPAEIDGLLSATYLLPKLAAVGLLRATTHQPGWIENRKVAGPEYSAAITPLTNAEDTLALYEILRMNRENAARSLGSLIDELVELQEAILTQDDPGLRSRLLDAIQEKDTWISQRQAASWEKEGRPPVLAGQRSGDLLGRLFGRRKKPNP